MCECHLGTCQIKDDGQTVRRKELQGQHKPKCHLSAKKGKPISRVRKAFPALGGPSPKCRIQSTQCTWLGMLGHPKGEQHE